MMDKRGQLYILTAIIFAFVIFVIITPANTVKRTVVDDNFEEIAKNFEVESAKFLNHLIETEQPIASVFLNFTLLFTSYARTKSPDYGLMYLFMKGDRVYIGNFAKEQATITIGSNQYIISGCFSQVSPSFSVGGLSLAIPIDINSVVSCMREEVVPSGTSFPLTIGIVLEELDTSAATTFTTQVAQNNPDLIIIAKEKQGNVRKVYTRGKFI